MITRVESTWVTVPSSSALTIMPEFIATSRSSPVATIGGSDTRSGTAWRCMFEPISARLAPSCSGKAFSPAAVDVQPADQGDVRLLGGLDRADPAVVRDVEVADLEARALAVQPAGAERPEPPLVGQLVQRVGLVDDLRQLPPAEEVVDR